MSRVEVAEQSESRPGVLYRIRAYIGFRLLLLALWVIPKQYRKGVVPTDRPA